MLVLCASMAAYAQVGDFANQASIGDDGGLGVAEFTDGVYRMEASGNDVWGSADGFFFIWNDVEGSFRITAEVEWGPMIIPEGPPSAGHEWKKAGVMARADDPVDPGARHVNSFVRTDSNGYMQQREDLGGSSVGIGEIPNSADNTNVVRLERFGNTFVASRQLSDGSFATLGTQVRDDFPESVAVGLFLTAHDVNELASAYFHNVTFEELDVTGTASRVIGDDIFVEPGQTLAGVTVSVALSEGDSADAVYTETLPAGISAANVSASEGDATVDGNVITWDLPGLSGEATLTYDAQVNADAAFTSQTWSGVLNVANMDFSVGGDNSVMVLPSEENGLGIFEGSLDIYDTFERLGAYGTARFDPNTGTYFVIGSGWDVWETDDAFHYLYLEIPVDADFVLSAYLDLDPFTSTDEWAKGMLMAREELDPFSVNITTRQRPDGQYSTQWRTDYAGSSASTAGDLRRNEGWTVFEDRIGRYRLERQGDLFITSYQDPNSGEYIVLDQNTLVFPYEESLYIGLGVTSHQVGTLSIGKFSNVTLTVGDDPVSVSDWALF